MKAPILILIFALRLSVFAQDFPPTLHDLERKLSHSEPGIAELIQSKINQIKPGNNLLFARHCFLLGDYHLSRSDIKEAQLHWNKGTELLNKTFGSKSVMKQSAFCTE